MPGFGSFLDPVGADRAGLLSGDMKRIDPQIASTVNVRRQSASDVPQTASRLNMIEGEARVKLGAPAARAGRSRARAINRHELRGNEAGQAAPPATPTNAHDDHGRADATGTGS